VRARAERLGFVHDERRPEFVISCGGDGTLLRAERQYPGLPKLPVKSSRLGRKYTDHSLSEALSALGADRHRIERFLKLEAVVRHHGRSVRHLALNDVIIRNQNLAKAIRFTVSVGGRDLCGELIGDGIVIATPFGSTAYYHSITRKTFQRGIGIALNNTANEVQPMVVGDSAVVKIRVIRGPAAVAADNYPLRSRLDDGDSVIVRRAARKAIILKINRLFSA
jgi:NAD+ kinase